jgi:AAA domain-containing protein
VTQHGWKAQEPGEPPRSLPPGVPIPATFHAGWGPRPEGYPEEMTWPPVDDDEHVSVAVLWGLMPRPESGFGYCTGWYPDDGDVDAAEAVAPPTPGDALWRAQEEAEELERDHEAAIRANESTPEDDEAFIRREAADLAARTANGMPDTTGWSSAQELAKRLMNSRDYIVLMRTMGDPAAWSARDKIAYDLAVTKLAARETRYEMHLYEFLYQFSVVFPHVRGQSDPRDPATGEAIPFAEYYPYLVGTVREALRATPPVRSIERPRTVAELAADPERLMPPVAVAPGLAWRKRDVLFAGREKMAGKSTLLTAAAAAVTRGAAFLGGTTAKGHVLWVSADFEPEADVVQRFLRFGGDGARMTLDYPSGSFDARLDRLHALITGLNPALVIVDSLAPFMLVDEVSQSTEWTNNFAAVRDRLKALDAARVWVHHTTKGTGEYRDSTAIGAMVDQILYYENPDPRSGTATRKVWGLGRVVGWRPFDVRLDGDAFALAEAPTTAAIDANEDEAVHAWIAAHPDKNTSDIAGALGRNKQEVVDALGRLKSAGRVEDRGHERHHRWAVVPARGNIAA